MNFEDITAAGLSRLALQITDSEPLEGLELPGIVLLEQIGRGGMGLVYKAQQLEPDRVVAVKFPQHGHSQFTNTSTELFRAEITALSSLEHPHIARVYGARVSGSSPYIVMEYVDGKALDEYLGPRPDHRTVLKLIRQTAEAVAYMHSCGVVHGDLKPENILMSKTGVKIVDLGLARLLSDDAHTTEALPVLGTPHYIAPEHLRGVSALPTPRSDVYALGAVLHKTLLGRHAHAIDLNAENWREILGNQPPQLPRELPADVAALVLKALQPDPAHRYATAAEFAGEITRYFEKIPLLARPLSPLGRAVRHWQRNSKRWVAGVISVSAAGYHLVATTKQTQREVIANQRINQELAHAEFMRGTRHMRADEPSLALAWFARCLRREPQNQAAARAAAHTILHGGMLLPLGESRLQADFSGQTYKSQMELSRAIKPQHGTEGRHFMNSMLGILWWDFAAARSLGVLHENKSGDAWLAFDHRDDLVASVARQNGQLFLSRVNADHFEVIFEQSLGQPVSDVRFISKECLLVIGAENQVWLFCGKQGGWALEKQFMLPGKVTAPHGYAVIADPRMLIWATAGKNTLERFDLTAGVILTPTQPLAEGSSASFIQTLADGKSILAAGERSQSCIDAISGKLVSIGPIPSDFWPTGGAAQWTGSVVDLKQAGDTTLIASADQRVRAYNAMGFLSRPPMDIGQPLRGLIVDPLKQRFLCSDFNGGISYWDWSSASAVLPRLYLGGDHRLFSGGFADDGKMLWTVSGTTLQRWQIRDRFAGCRECATVIKGQWNARISIDAAWQNALLTTPTGFAGVFSLERSASPGRIPLAKPPHVDTVGSGSPDALPGGIGLLTLDGLTSVTWAAPHTLSIGNGKTSWQASFQNQEPILLARLHPNGELLAYAGSRGSISILNLATRKLLAAAQPFLHSVRCLEWFPDKKGTPLLAATDIHGNAGLWQANSWTIHTVPPSLADAMVENIQELCFHPDKSTLYLAAFDQASVYSLAIEEIGPWSEIPKVKFSAPLRCLAISPDGKLMAGGLYNGDACLVDIKQNREIARLPHRLALRDVVFTPDSQVLAVACADAEAHLWDVAKAERISPPLRGRHVDTTEPAMQSVQMHPEGRFFATTNAKGQAYVWDLFQTNSKAPAALPAWLENLARLRIGDDNQPKPLPPMPTAQLSKALDLDGPWQELLRSVLPAPQPPGSP